MQRNRCGREEGAEEREGRGKKRERTDSGQSGKTISFCLLRYLLLLCPSPFSSSSPPLCPGAFFARIFLSPKDTFSFRSAAHSKLHTAKRRGGICLLLIPPEMDDPALQRAKAKGIEGKKKRPYILRAPFLKKEDEKNIFSTHTHMCPPPPPPCPSRWIDVDVMIS